MRRIVVLALALGGCATNPALSGDSIKNANLVCGDASTMGGTGHVMAVTLDQNVIKAGNLTAKCGEQTMSLTILPSAVKP